METGSCAVTLSQRAAARLGRAAGPRSPKAAKLVTVLAALYIVSPIDFVPDSIPILGWLDDGLIGFVLLQLAFRFLPAELLASLRERVGAKVG